MDDEQTEPAGREPDDPAAVAEQTKQVLAHWDAVIADMEATAEEYRERGWDVVAVHPGDVVAIDGSGDVDRWGLDVLAPDDEFDEVERVVADEGEAFDACEVFKAQPGGMVYLVVAMLDEAGEAAVVFPAYYDPADRSVREMLARARQTGEMRTHVRPLDERLVVTFTQGDPALFEPE